MPGTTTKLARRTKSNSVVARMEKAGPSRTKLRRLVAKKRPPQSWYDEIDCPFKPAKR